MALAMLGLVVGSALLLVCILILLDRATRPRRASAHCPAGGDSGWIPSMAGDTGTADCSADGGGGCDGGGGGD